MVTALDVGSRHASKAKSTPYSNRSRSYGPEILDVESTNARRSGVGGARSGLKRRSRLHMRAANTSPSDPSNERPAMTHRPKMPRCRNPRAGPTSWFILKLRGSPPRKSRRGPVFKTIDGLAIPRPEKGRKWRPGFAPYLVQSKLGNTTAA
jgi:hypothetical protein